MKNIGDQHFTYDTFKSIFDADPSIQELVKDFDQNSLTLKTDNNNAVKTDQPRDKNKINQMAKRAVDL
jgi:hypothetical protein